MPRESPAQAIEHAERALTALAEEHPDPTRPPATIEEAVAVTRHELGDSERALADLRDVLRRTEAAFGSTNLEVASKLSRLAQVEQELGETDDAIAHAQAALSIARQTLGEDSPRLAHYHTAAATTYMAAMRMEAADEHFVAAVAAAQRAARPDAVTLCRARINLALLAVYQQRAQLAVERADEALAGCTEAFGPSDPNVVAALNVGAHADSRADNPDRAQRRYERALELASPESSSREEALNGLAQLHLDGGRPEQAVPLLEEAVAQWEGRGLDLHAAATTQFNLGRALWESGRDRPRARQLVAGARQHYAELGEPGQAAVDEIDRWITDVAKLVVDDLASP